MNCRPDDSIGDSTRSNVFGVIQRTGPSRPSRSPLVMIVDDDPDSREMYTVGLSVTGFQPVVATTAEDAFSQACHVHPDAIVTDIVLPDMSGLDLTRRLRGDPRTTDTSIIVLTGHASDSIRQDARDAGCDRFLIKPCLPDVLAIEIRHVLASRDYMSDST